MEEREEFEWRAGVTCPYMYPVRVHASVLIFDDGYTYLDSGGFLRGKWKGAGSTNTTDSRIKKHLTAWWYTGYRIWKINSIKGCLIFPLRK